MSHLSVDIDTLTKEERLSLLEALWESLDLDRDIPVTSAQKSELKARKQALREGNLKTYPVDEILNAIRSKNVPS